MSRNAACSVLAFWSVFFGVSVLANPLMTRDIGAHLYPRANPCEPGGTPILYKEYHSDLCPPKFRLKPPPDNSCPLEWQTFAEGCTTYCEIRQWFSYGQEVPVVNNPYCHGPLTCKVSSSKATTYTWSAHVNAGWMKAFVAGITGGYSSADTITTLQSTLIDLKRGECGYFTFLPTLHNSCGSLTEGIWGNRKCNFPTTYGNVCTQQPARTPDGKGVRGATIFVWTDCGTNERLPMEKQDEAYRHPGVAQPQSLYEEFLEMKELD